MVYVQGNVRNFVPFITSATDGYEFRLRWYIAEQHWETKTTKVQYYLEGRINTNYVPANTSLSFGGIAFTIRNDNYADSAVTDVKASYGTGDDFRLNYGEDWKVIKEGIHTFTGSSNYNDSGTKTFIYTRMLFSYSIYDWNMNTLASSATVYTVRACAPYTFIYEMDNEINDSQNPTMKYMVTSDEATEATLYYGNGRTVELSTTVTPTARGIYSHTFNISEEQRNILHAEFGDETVLTNYYAYILSAYEGLETSTHTQRMVITLADGEPIVAPTVVDINEIANALTGSPSALIKFVSNVKATMNAQAQKEAVLETLTITNGNTVATGGEYTFEKVDTNKFTFKAVDNRAQITEKSLTLPMIEYVPLTCKINSDSTTGEGEMRVTCSGNYWTGNFGAVDNNLQVFYRYRKSSEDAFTEWALLEDIETDEDGQSYSATHLLTGLDYQASYVFQCRAQDAVGYIDSAEKTVATLPVFDWSQRDFNFNVPVTIQGEQAAKLSDIPSQEEMLSVLNQFNMIRNAFTNRETLTTTFTKGELASTGELSAQLVGNMLYCKLTAENSSYYWNGASGSVLATYTIEHGGKIADIPTVDLAYRYSRDTRVIATLKELSNENGVSTLELRLKNTSASAQSIEVAFTLPVILNFEAFMEED